MDKNNSIVYSFITKYLYAVVTQKVTIGKFFIIMKIIIEIMKIIIET